MARKRPPARMPRAPRPRRAPGSPPATAPPALAQVPPPTATADRAPIDIRVLSQFLDGLESYSTDLVQHLRSGQTLCHYSSLAGAIGIVQSGDLWLTNLRYSNDDEELRHGLRVLETVLQRLEAEALDDARRAWLAALRAELSRSATDQIYICCFCEEDNLLSQWRGYADNGGGLSLEFDAPGFSAIAGPDCRHGLMRLWKVLYDPAQQERVVRACIDYPYWPAATPEARLRSVADALQFFLPAFKNPDFAGEKERRLIFTPYPNATVRPMFRARGGLLVPYVSLLALVDRPGFRLPLKHVLVGPSMHRALNVESVTLLLRQHQYPHVPVHASTTPYRA